MNNSRATKYYNLDNNWGMLSYEFNSKALPISEYNFIRIENSNTSPKSVTLCNFHPQGYENIKRETNNSLENSIFINSSINNEYVKLDLETSLGFVERVYPDVSFKSYYYRMNDTTDPNNPLLNLNGEILLYDSVKIHLLQGYNFNIGFIVKVSLIDKESPMVLYLAQVAYLKDDTLKLHKTPIRFNDAIYDRYFEIAVPTLESLQKINHYSNDLGVLTDAAKVKIEVLEISQEFINTPTDLLHILTYDAFLEDSPILVISKEDVNDKISCNIQESVNGDYFEFYAKYGSGFISDYINEIRSFYIGSVIIFHELTIYEHVANEASYKDIPTSIVTYMQNSAFDQPYYFRPVIQNSNAISFTIDYQIRIVHDYMDGGEQIGQVVRNASLTFKDAHKYGRSLQKLNIDTNSPYKIVNKIVSNKTNTTDSNLNIRDNFYASPFLDIAFSNFNILKSNFVLPIERVKVASVVKNLNDSNPDSSIKFFGEAEINLHKYSDCFLLFELHEDRDGNIVPLNILKDESLIKYNLVIKTDGGELRVESTFPFSKDNTNIDVKPNDLYFFLSKENIQLITDGYFYIEMVNLITNQTSRQIENFSVVLYSGSFQII